MGDNVFDLINVFLLITHLLLSQVTVIYLLESNLFAVCNVVNIELIVLSIYFETDASIFKQLYLLHCKCSNYSYVFESIHFKRRMSQAKISPTSSSQYILKDACRKHKFLPLVTLNQIGTNFAPRRN